MALAPSKHSMAAHGRFKLENLLRRVILGVDRLFVLNHGKRDESSIFIECLLETIQSDPEVVGMEETMLGNILEVILVVVGAHGRLTEDQLAVCFTDSKVTSLFVVFGRSQHSIMNGRFFLAKYVKMARSKFVPRLSELETSMYLSPSGKSLSRHPDPTRAAYKSPCPGGHHSLVGLEAQVAGCCTEKVVLLV